MNKDDYETIVFEHDIQKDIMTDCLRIVKEYIQRKKLILVGGMAIDMALRSKGSKLYPDTKFPDFDFYSPEFHRDAYRIGEILAEKYDGVSVISAFHVSTMKVRVNFSEVADISYVPPELYNKLPTMEYDNFRIIHPEFQMIDQHRALSLPFEKPPLETIFGRWSKDIERYDLLKPFHEHKHKLPTTAKPREISTPKGACLCGPPALLYWISLAEKDGFKHSGPKWLSSYSNTKCELPSEYTICYLTDSYQTTCDEFKGLKTHYRPILDKVESRCVIDDNITIFNNKGNLVGWHESGRCVNLQHIMCYLLTMGVMYNQDAYSALYDKAQKLLLWVCDQYSKDPSDKWLKFLPTVEVFGEHNTYDAYDVAKENIDVMFDKTERTLFTPKNAYPTPDKKNVDPKLYQFEPSESPLYLLDGVAIKDKK